ncbi:solute carrier family protein [Blastocystis sp. subtype 4]|uniref:solute carrier family protein n=1 Tax=Blastocystis sp. subtype 4 TaxID=944170 RepID=UPI00071142D6|nr:solute carrier family protein [Blastocystis sp. subtype 4]KNB44132.1 solute carrier family protein [Blastocystis sp. subtype 4]|eukprot:XP_014527575.1 solute carrier family protein [Blastocystis sp. subtype 4]
MDIQYYKRLLISISGIYIVYLSYGLVQEKIYRYVSPDGTSFQYTSVLLLIQCTINYVIAVLGKSYYAIGQERKRFSLQIPKKDLVGRAVIYHVKGKE